MRSGWRRGDSREVSCNRLVKKGISTRFSGNGRTAVYYIYVLLALAPCTERANRKEGRQQVDVHLLSLRGQLGRIQGRDRAQRCEYYSDLHLIVESLIFVFGSAQRTEIRRQALM